MNRIYWDKDKISMLTDHLDAAEHSHWMKQLFLSFEGNLDIRVSGEWISCACILVNKHVPHSFSANKKPHFSAVIEPASSLAKQLNEIIKGENYHIFDPSDLMLVQESAIEMLKSADLSSYARFTKTLYRFLGIKEQRSVYDDRIKDFLSLIDDCDCDGHTISLFAAQVALSPSRLAHLFREQVGVPLKSYILLHQMERAFTELLNGKNITESSMLAGFDTPSHFAATTKRMMGMPASLSLKDSVFLKVR